ncbi:multiheme c-type cytochrome [Bacteroidota bacterium]
MRRLFLLLVLPVIGLVSCVYNEEGSGIVPLPPPELKYVGSDACGSCHPTQHTTFSESGHPYKLSEVDGIAPTYPFTTLDHVPDGYSWDDISYVIGGYAWRANYIDDEGYIITGDDAQWNYQTGEAGPYHAGVNPGTEKYECGACHTTGWKSVANGGSPQGDMPGMDGEFFAGGIQCEACHGMGSFHLSSKSTEDITIDRESEACGQCHSSNGDGIIAASEGFIHNYEQYNEMSAAGHTDLSCNDCHDPHVTVKHDQVGGIIQVCTDCHTEITTGAEHRGADCLTCHMPYASKSAVSTNKYVADLKTHIFKINPAEDGIMFNVDSTQVNGENGVTLDFVCYQCHKDEAGIGGEKSEKTMSRLSGKATGYHTP